MPAYFFNLTISIPSFQKFSLYTYYHVVYLKLIFCYVIFKSFFLHFLSIWLFSWVLALTLSNCLRTGIILITCFIFCMTCTVKLLKHWQTCLSTNAENCYLKLTSRQDFVSNLSRGKILKITHNNIINFSK